VPADITPKRTGKRLSTGSKGKGKRVSTGSAIEREFAIQAEVEIRAVAIRASKSWRQILHGR
jgi:hypothetical protein